LKSSKKAGPFPESRLVDRPGRRRRYLVDVSIAKTDESLLIFVATREFTKIGMASVEVVRPRDQKFLPKARKVPLTQLITVVYAFNTRNHHPFHRNVVTCTSYEAQPCAQPFFGHEEAC
jgi:hypothetical protein